jgi:hypothetical protein
MPTITGPRASAQIDAYLSGKDPQLRAVANALRALYEKLTAPLLPAAGRIRPQTLRRSLHAGL